MSLQLGNFLLLRFCACCSNNHGLYHDPILLAEQGLFIFSAGTFENMIEKLSSPLTDNSQIYRQDGFPLFRIEKIQYDILKKRNISCQDLAWPTCKLLLQHDSKYFTGYCISHRFDITITRPTIAYKRLKSHLDLLN